MGNDIFNQYFNLNKDSIISMEDVEKQLSQTLQPAIKRPAMYEVIILNDDITPEDFVITAIKIFFRKADNEANAMIQATHKTGKATCGIYTREVAETKIVQVINFARSNNHPLKCVMYKETK